MMTTDNPEKVISQLKKGRLVFFGPSWGVVVVDVVEGQPVRVQSSWGGDERVELERLRSWGRVRFLVKPLPEDLPAQKPQFTPVLYKGSIENLKPRPTLSEKYEEALLRAFPKTEKIYPEREWINVLAVAAELSGVRLLRVAGSGQEGWVLVNRGKAVSARWGSSLNAEAVKKLSEDNQFFPLEVEIRAPEMPEVAALAFGLPAVAEPVLEGLGPAVARGWSPSKEPALVLLDDGAWAFWRGRAYSTSGEEIPVEEARRKIAGSKRAAVYEPIS